MWLQYLGYSVRGAQLTPSGKQKSVSAFNVFSSSSLWNRTIPSFCAHYKVKNTKLICIRDRKCFHSLSLIHIDLINIRMTMNELFKHIIFTHLILKKKKRLFIVMSNGSVYTIIFHYNRSFSFGAQSSAVECKITCERPLITQLTRTVYVLRIVC